MGVISREKAILEYEAAEHQSNLKSWTSPLRKYVAPGLVVGGALFLLYIARRKVLAKKKPKPLFHNLVFQSPVQVKRKKKARIAKKVIAFSTPIVLALVRTSLVALVKKSIKNNGTTQRYPG